ncbi:lipoprotein [Mycoplasmopsis californica]|uniref:Lipoprotein n=1 Tax=Mycoplasmopsis californica TaxID=2113 RepID=A0A059XRK7_9BACT|nr:variable surface lipoprotein [Mycoplasmopsis californica]AIA29665.1 lipoprotein [Mycoplasmopsis californica]
MKKFKTSLILGSLTSVAAVPFVAASCGSKDSSAPKIAELEQKISTLESQQSSNAELKKLVPELKTKLDTIKTWDQAQIDQLKAQIEAQNNAKVSTRTTKIALLMALSAQEQIKTEKEFLEKSYPKLAQARKAKEMIAKLEAEIAAKTKEVETKTAEKVAKEAELTKAQADVKAKEEALNKATEAKTKADEVVKATEGSQTELTKAIEQLKASINKFKEELEKTTDEAKKEQTKATITTLEEQLKLLEAGKGEKLKVAKDAQTEAQKLVTQATEAKDKAESSVKEIETQKTKLEEEITAKTKEVETKTAEKVAKEAEYTQADNATPDSVKKLLASLEAIEAKIAELKKEATPEELKEVEHYLAVAKELERVKGVENKILALGNKDILLLLQKRPEFKKFILENPEFIKSKPWVDSLGRLAKKERVITEIDNLKHSEPELKQLFEEDPTLNEEFINDPDSFKNI